MVRFAILNRLAAATFVVLLSAVCTSRVQANGEPAETVALQEPAHPVRVDALSLPAAGEIALDGVVKSVMANGSRLTIDVQRIQTADGKVQVLKTPRKKTIVLGEAAPIFLVDGESATKATAELLRIGATLRCLGANGGEGTPLVSRLIVVLRTAEEANAATVAARVHPKENLLPPLDNKANYRLNHNSDSVGAVCTVEGKVLKIAVSQADGQDWHLTLGASKGIDLVDGVAYHLSFEAKADQKRNFRVMALINQPDYHNIGLYEPFTAETDWKPFQFTFAPHDTAAEHSTCPLFLLGKEVGELDIRNLTLVALDAPVVPGNLLQPISDPGTWQILTYGGSEASITHENDALCVTVAKATVAWNVQVTPHQVALKEGQSYTVRFRAWSPMPRKLTISSGTSTPPYHKIGLDSVVEIGPERKLYTLHFRASQTVTADKGANIAPIFPVGDSVGTLYLSEISVVTER